MHKPSAMLLSAVSNSTFCSASDFASAAFSRVVNSKRRRLAPRYRTISMDEMRYNTVISDMTAYAGCRRNAVPMTIGTKSKTFWVIAMYGRHELRPVAPAE